MISSADDQTVRVWDVETTRTLQIIDTGEGWALDFFPDSKSIIISDMNLIKSYPLDFSHMNLNPVKLLRNLELDAGVYLDGFFLKLMTPKEFRNRKNERTP